MSPIAANPVLAPPSAAVPAPGLATPAQSWARLGQEARALMESGGALCAPAVLGVLDQRLGGGLGRDMVDRLTAAFPKGMHNAGDVCGALSGGMLALGLFLGQGRGLEKATRALHRQFEAAHGSANCLVLTRQAGGRQARRELCLELTGLAASLAARLILEQRPELAPALGSSSPSPAPRPNWWRRLRQS